jgi:hypothetical protein
MRWANSATMNAIGHDHGKQMVEVFSFFCGVGRFSGKAPMARHLH